MSGLKPVKVLRAAFTSSFVFQKITSLLKLIHLSKTNIILYPLFIADQTNKKKDSPAFLPVSLVLRFIYIDLWQIYILWPFIEHGPY